MWAQRRIAWFYKNGVGLPKNFKEAVRWYKKAVDESGDELSMIALGNLYEKGTGAPKNFNAARVLYEKCAMKGNPHCQIELARVFREGNGVNKNLIVSYKWLALAAAALPDGEEKASIVVARIELTNDMTEDQLNDARRRVNDWQQINVGSR